MKVKAEAEAEAASIRMIAVDLLDEVLTEFVNAAEHGLDFGHELAIWMRHEFSAHSSLPSTYDAAFKSSQGLPSDAPSGARS